MRTSLIGHPPGLAWLSAAEFWERFSYYGMQALLVLYMTHRLLLPGHVDGILGFQLLRRVIEAAYGPLSPQGLASAIFGLYAGAVFVTPIAGGYIADRFLGRTRTIVCGALLMAAGHFLMAIEAAFLIALSCLLIGAGCFKGNIAAQVGELYAPGDDRVANGFQIYFVAISLAIIVAPLVCGTLGEIYGYHWGFAAAGFGMLIGLLIYLRGTSWVSPPRPSPPRREAGTRLPMSREDRRKLFMLLAMLPVLGVAQVVTYQSYNAYVLWAESNYVLQLGHINIPVTWLFSFGSFVSVLTLVGSVLFWRWWARFRSEPSQITKITLSALLVSASPLLLALASYVVSTTGHRVSLGWAVGFEVINDIGYANSVPVGLALYSRAAPKALEGAIVGIYFLHLFVANMLAGYVGSLMGRLPATEFWGLHAALVFAAALVLVLVHNPVRRVLEPDSPGCPA
jgi:POT family proton-dependent oligopeptide transporter